MREKLKRIGVLLLAGILSIVIYSCKNGTVVNPLDSYDTVDTAQVAQLIEDWMNPSLYSVEEVLTLHQEMINADSIDKAFTSIPTPIVKNVATVLLKNPNYKSIKKKDIIGEFRQHKNIYINIPSATIQTKDTVKPVDLNATDLGNRRGNKIISTAYSYRTDTINGKPVRIQIKTEESYE
jgi:hypothetical protein